MPSLFPTSAGLEVTPEQTAQAIADGTAVVIDVREPYEREAGYAEGTRHITLTDLSSQAGSLDRDATVVFVCRVGGRSLMAAQALRASGYDAWSMAGGMLRWDAEGRALLPDGGHVADH